MRLRASQSFVTRYVCVKLLTISVVNGCLFSVMFVNKTPEQTAELIELRYHF